MAVVKAGREMTESTELAPVCGISVVVPMHSGRLPLLRWTVFELAPGDHLLLQVEHHFVHDGWSLAVFLRQPVTRARLTAKPDGPARQAMRSCSRC